MLNVVCGPIEQAVEAERSGLELIAVSDHFQPWRHRGGHSPAALPWLGAACAVYRHGEPVVDLWGGVRDARASATPLRHSTAQYGASGDSTFKSGRAGSWP